MSKIQKSFIKDQIILVELLLSKLLNNKQIYILFLIYRNEEGSPFEVPRLQWLEHQLDTAVAQGTATG